MRPWNAEPAAAATAGDTPAYLLRSSYLKLSTPDFSSSRLGEGAGLKLSAVADLGAADVVKELVNSEDAFSLTFYSDTAFAGGTRSLAHPDLGVFELFISPVDGQGAYEAIVNRSVGVPKRPPKPANTAPDDKKPPVQRPAHAPHVHRLAAHRSAKGVVAEIGLNPDQHVKSATVWLTRGGLVVASATTRHVNGRRVAIRIPMHKRLRGGRYELTAGTKDSTGHTEYKRVRIALQ